MTNAAPWTSGELAGVVFRGIGWRHVAPGYDPTSGEGARLRGGRFNPPLSYPVLYLCTTRECVGSELRRLGSDNPAIGVEGMLPRELFRYSVDLAKTLDLRDEETRVAVGIDLEALTGRGWRACQSIGLTANALGFQAIVAPSATGTDDVIAVLVQNLGGAQFEVVHSETWTRENEVPDGA